MKAIKSYEVVSGYNIDYIIQKYDLREGMNIVEIVNAMIQIGWEPLGGAASIGTAHDAYYMQAMVLRYED